MEAEIPDKTADEVSFLKSLYQKKCRVIKTVGDFTYVISLHLSENVLLKFQLTASYPQVIPSIAILSLNLPGDCFDELRALLMKKADELIGKAMIQNLTNEAVSWLQTSSYSHNPDVEQKNSKSPRAKKKTKCGKKNVDKDKSSEKKPSMRTSANVISRILWDKNLPLEEFTVGYLDRFSGIQEKPFSAFSWEDIASVDNHTLAIPKHRICYFKYKTVKVWDKEQRLDMVFGSTGDTTSLSDVMLNENMQNCHEDSNSDPVNSLSCHSLASSLPDPNFNFGDDFPRADNRANFFIGLRIYSEEIQQRASKWQSSIFQEEPAYKDCRVDPSRLHVTLCALCLERPDLIARAAEILESSKQELSKMAEFACALRIKDVKYFPNRIVYAGVEAPPQFLQLTELLKSRFQVSGLLHRDRYKTYQPHMTLFKIGRDVLQENYVKAINKRICERYSGYWFGEQNLDNLHLCSMGKIRQEDGFYKCLASLQLRVKN